MIPSMSEHGPGMNPPSSMYTRSGDPLSFTWNVMVQVVLYDTARVTKYGHEGIHHLGEFVEDIQIHHR